MREYVLVLPTELFTTNGLDRGYRRIYNLIHEYGRFISRDLVETDERYKQVIPYVVMTCGDQVMSYVRGGRSNEVRLRGCRSIGIGGHVKPIDDYMFAFTQSIDREVEEEVSVNTVHADSIVALLNDDSNPVGRVHLGVVYHWRLTMPKVEAKEEGKITDVQWNTSVDLLAMELESWSRIVLESGVLC